MKRPTEDLIRQIAAEVKVMQDTAIIIVTSPEEKKDASKIVMNNLPAIEANKDYVYQEWSEVTDENPLQGIVVVSNIEGVRYGQRVYLSNKYFPTPAMYKGIVLHRIWKNDIVLIFDAEMPMDDFFNGKRKGLGVKNTLKKEYDRKVNN